MTTTTRFAWCFDHGSLHRFFGETWCSASWVYLAGTTEAEALSDKTARFGDAVFYHHLPVEQQVVLANAHRESNFKEER